MTVGRSNFRENSITRLPFAAINGLSWGGIILAEFFNFLRLSHWKLQASIAERGNENGRSI